MSLISNNSSSTSSMLHLAEEFHNHVEHFHALLAAAATNANAIPNSKNNNNTVSHFDIRHCLRQIQGMLQRDDLVLLATGKAADGTSHHHHHPPPQDQHQQDAQALLTQDLMTLVTLDVYSHHHDASVTELMDQWIIPRAAAQLVTTPLTQEQLQLMLPRVLHLIQQQSQNASSPSPVLVPLLDLLNQHLNADNMAHILPNEHDCFVALQLVLEVVVGTSPPLPLRVFLSSLLDYWTQHVLQQSSQQSSSSSSSYQESQQDPAQQVSCWVERQFLLQNQYQQPQVLRNQVDDFLGRLEHYGMELLEMALQMLEEPTGGGGEGSEEEDEIVTTLQYSTLAVTLILSMDWFAGTSCCGGGAGTITGNTTSSSSNTSSIRLSSGMTKSLWHALAGWIVQRMEGQGTNENERGVEQRQQGSCSLACQMAATDALWRLTQHFVATSATSHNNSTEDQDSFAMIIATAIWRLWKYAECSYDHGDESHGGGYNNYCWNDTTEAWIHQQLQHPKYGRPLRHALQASILSVALLPCSNDYSSARFAALARLVVAVEPQRDQNANSSNQKDPWQSLVRDHLSAYSIELQQHNRSQSQHPSNRSLQ